MRYLSLVLFLLSCQQTLLEPSEVQLAHWKTEVREAEQAFAELAEKEGIKTAFLSFADDSAVLLRGDQLIHGKAEISAYLSSADSDTIEQHLYWSPDFVEMANSGDLAYTYGKYSYERILNEDTTRSNGYFHTVWKRQADGSWKYVWD